MTEAGVWSQLGQVVMTKGPPAGVALWESFTTKQRTSLAALYFLFSQPKRNIEQFVTQKLIQRLSLLERNTERQLVENVGQVRGRVNWPATYKARYSQDYDPGRFLCHETHPRYDIPPNQLLKYVVQQLALCLENVPEEIRTGWAYFHNQEQPTMTRLAQQVGRMETTLVNFRRHVHIREVTLPARLTEQHILQAQTARSEIYREALAIYEWHKAFMARWSWASLVRSGRDTLFLPGRNPSWWLTLNAAIIHHSNDNN